MISIRKAFNELDIFEECCVNADPMGATESIVRLAKMSNCSPMLVLYAIQESSTKNFDLPAMVMTNTLIKIVEEEMEK